jgi:hypothetical protein
MTRRSWILLATAAVFGCGLAEDLRHVQAVQAALTTAHGGQFQVNLNNRTRMQVQVFNAGRAARARPDSVEFLESVARTAYRAFERRDTLETLSVGYVEVSGTAGANLTVTYPGRSWSGSALRALADTSTRHPVILSLPPGT